MIAVRLSTLFWLPLLFIIHFFPCRLRKNVKKNNKDTIHLVRCICHSIESLSTEMCATNTMSQSLVTRNKMKRKKNDYVTGSTESHEPHKSKLLISFFHSCLVDTLFIYLSDYFRCLRSPILFRLAFPNTELSIVSWASSDTIFLFFCLLVAKVQLLSLPCHCF